MSEGRPVRVAVTGAAGYLGRTLVGQLARNRGVDEVLALDLRPLSSWPEGVEAHVADVTNPGMEEVFRGVDVVCHLAFALDAGIPGIEARRVNLEGTRAVAHAALRAGVRKLIVASSVSAYGVGSDRFGRIDEGVRLSAGRGFRYAHHKALVERWLEDLAQAHPDLAVVRLRLCTILGPGPRPGRAASLLRAPVVALPRSLRVQVVHVEDAAQAFLTSLRPQARGAYNVAAEPPLTGADLARILGKPHLPLPDWAIAGMGSLWRLVGGRDPARLEYLRHPLLVDCSRIREELGWSPRHDATTTMRAYVAG